MARSVELPALATLTDAVVGTLSVRPATILVRVPIRLSLARLLTEVLYRAAIPLNVSPRLIRCLLMTRRTSAVVLFGSTRFDLAEIKGTLMTLPEISLDRALIPFKLARLPVVVPYRFAMPLIVSPRLTRYRPVARLFFATLVLPDAFGDRDGTLIYLPATSFVRALIPLSRASAPIVVPWRAAIPLSVSPRLTL